MHDCRISFDTAALEIDQNGDRPDPAGREIKVELSQFGFPGPVEVRDLWWHASLGDATGIFSSTIPFHGAGLFRLAAK